MNAVLPHAQSGHRLRVLVADPDADTRSLYRHTFELAGCDVLESSDGRDALAKALVGSPSLVVTDIRLPMLDGCALCEILRRDPVTRSVPILVVTAEVRPAEWSRIRRAGADAVLVKPVPLDDLLRETERLITSLEDAAGTSPSTRDAAEQLDACANRLARSGRSHSQSRARLFSRFTTTTPPTPAPSLMCPSCDQPLTYEHSHIGGVNERNPEQWDQFVCVGSCGMFQYRQRTRTLRRVQ